MGMNATKTKPNIIEERIRNVVLQFHRTLAADIEEILGQFDSYVIRDTSEGSLLIEAKNLFLYLIQRLQFHTLLEENIVFAVILKSLETGEYKNLTPMLESMELEHQEDRKIIQRIMGRLASYQKENNDLEDLIKLMHRFQVVFEEHSHFEDELVFKPYRNLCLEEPSHDEVRRRSLVKRSISG